MDGRVGKLEQAHVLAVLHVDPGDLVAVVLVGLAPSARVVTEAQNQPLWPEESERLAHSSHAIQDGHSDHHLDVEASLSAGTLNGSPQSRQDFSSRQTDLTGAKRVWHDAPMNGYRLATAAETAATKTAAREIADAMIAVTRKQMTADDFRAIMRAQRTDLGDLFDVAKAQAVPMHIAACG